MRPVPLMRFNQNRPGKARRATGNRGIRARGGGAENTQAHVHLCTCALVHICTGLSFTHTDAQRVQNLLMARVGCFVVIQRHNYSHTIGTCRYGVGALRTPC
jgi:hypothetical protein